MKEILKTKQKNFVLLLIKQGYFSGRPSTILIFFSFSKAFWTRFFPLYQDLQQMIKNGVIGDVRVVNVTFGFQVIETWERVMDPKQGGSTLLEIGVYTLNIADMVYDGEEPEKVDAVGFLNDLGTDLTDSITLMYSKRRIAQLLISSSR